MKKKIGVPEPHPQEPFKTLKLLSVSMPSADFGIVKFLTIEQGEEARNAFLKQRAELREKSAKAAAQLDASRSAEDNGGAP